MRHADLGGGGDAYYTYDAGGERVRKFIQRIGTTTEERIYLGGWELYRKRSGASQTIEIERETLHLMDDTRRIAMIETLTIDASTPVTTPVPRIRYQYANHLDSAMLECDDAGDVISYEEYHPYGTAAYRSAKSGVEVSEKRYRYTGKERDEETGFQYHSARYYAPWLGRWTSADPAGMVDGPGLYSYVRNNPVLLCDVSGCLGGLLEFLDSVVNPTSSVARGITDNLAKRGEALVNAPAAIKKVYNEGGLAAVGKAAVDGAAHLVKDTGEAAGDIAYEATHWKGEESKKKIASRALDVVLNTADIVTLAAGAAGTAKTVGGVAKAVTASVKNVPKLAYAPGVGAVLLGGGAKAAVKLAPPSLTTVGSTTAMMSAAGKGAGAGEKPVAKPAADASTPSTPAADKPPLDPANKPTTPATEVGTPGSTPKKTSVDVNWTPHGRKHVASPKTSWNLVVDSTKSGPAKYLPGTDIEALERAVWARGAPVTTGKSWKVMEFSSEVGASGGRGSRWVRVEESAGTIHGHPITEAEFRKLTR